MNKKLRKFIRSPRLFIKDMLIKRQAKKVPVVNKITGNHKFSVVSAVYNVGRYLDKYFESLINQRLDFKDHLQLVLVDDGSIDNSAEIIKKWQQRYPENIIYLHKENGGQASARNLGIRHASHKWVTFIDPDDFVNQDYFLGLSTFIDKNKSSDLRMIGCHQIFYMEKTDKFKDDHPLRYKFVNGNKIFPIANMGANIQLSAATAIFHRSTILDNELEFDSRVKPNFEDGLFIAQYLAVCPSGSVGFIKDAVYYYRKREDGTSTLDTSWQHPGRLGAVLEHGYLGAFAAFDSHEKIPVHIQRTVLYDIVWIVRQLMDRPQAHAFLTQEQRARGMDLLREVCAHISVETVMQFELAGCWFMHKLAILESLKGTPPPFQIAYIEDMDEVKQQVLITIYTGTKAPILSYQRDGVDIIPDHLKVVEHKMLDEDFLHCWRCWLPLVGGTGKLAVKINGKSARLSLGGKLHQDTLPVGDIRKHFSSRTPRRRSVPRYENCWLLMDRDTHADDNAEHLYRHIARTDPSKNIFFVLDENSFDWDRLSRDGFKLLAYGSVEHRSAATCASKVISSHADAYVVDLLGKSTPVNQHFVFLQHGVTKDDLSGWLNKKKIHCFVTSADREYQSIGGSSGAYNVGSKETVLTGMPRHDRLKYLADTCEPKDILIMPTWRNALMAAPAGTSAKRVLVDNAAESTYATAWVGLLNDPELKRMAEQAGKRIVFFPHANMQALLEQLQIPEHIHVCSHAGTSIQELFASATMLITDYSSVAFEVAMIDRPVVYYQFDEREFFDQQTSYTRGYFDYRQDGFGPVVTAHTEVIAAANEILENRGSWHETYGPRIQNFFAFQDDENCARVVAAIEALDQPRGEVEGDSAAQMLRSMAATAYQLGDIDLATRRYRRLMEMETTADIEEVSRYLELVDSQAPFWFEKKDYERCVKSAKIAVRKAGEYQLQTPDMILAIQAASATAQKRWGLAAELWTARLDNDPDAPFAAAEALKHQGWLYEASVLLTREGVRPPGSRNEYQLAADLAVGAGDWKRAADLLLDMVFDYKDNKSVAVIERALKLYETHAAQAHLNLGETVELWTTHASRDSSMLYTIAGALHRQGKYALGYATLGSRLMRAPVSQAEWQLLADLAIASSDWGAAADALRLIAVRYSSSCPVDTLDKALDLYQRCKEPIGSDSTYLYQEETS